jgi:hypothetical protein
MEKINLRKSLYIGLGGTGMNAILHTKKMFLETFGEIPPIIGFLGIDTDNKSCSETIDSKVGKIYLEKNEQCEITATGPVNFFKTNKDLVAWMPKENEIGIST